MPETVAGCEWRDDFIEFLKVNRDRFGIKVDEASTIANELDMKSTLTLELVSWSWNSYNDTHLPLKGKRKKKFLNVIRNILIDPTFHRKAMKFFREADMYANYSTPYSLNKVRDGSKKSTSLGSECAIQTQDLRTLLGELRELCYD